MNTSLTRFRIEGLHNQRTIDIPIEDNKLVLVGENGTGKSTVANLIYFLLTFQWSRMLSTSFKSLTAEVSGNTYTFDLETIRRLANESQFLRRSSPLPPGLLRELERILEIEDSDERKHSLSRLAIEVGIPTRVLHREVGRLSDVSQEDRSKVRSLRNIVGERVLYLPTYRRIEQDLESIFPDIDIDRLRQARSGSRRNRSLKGHIELVEFGMEDVERTIQFRMSDIKENVRKDLSNLTGAYLRDIIKGAYKSVSAEDLRDIEAYSVDDIFKRIPDEILPAEDKLALKFIIEEINGLGQISDENRVVAHFLTKLVEFYEKQQADEMMVREFVRVCNDSYLSGKKFVYDDVSFDVYVEQHSDAEHLRRIPMQALSSGEKQIVSLFSHLYLSAESDFFVIIDEPELSLSVPWQRNFLPDILNRSIGLVAVTHSPFIFDNVLRPYAHSLEEFIQPFEYDPELEPLLPEEDIPF